MTGIELPGNEVRVVDENGRDVRQDGKMIGEIITKSNLVMKGYWKQPEETAQAIKGGWFHYWGFSYCGFRGLPNDC